MLPILPRQLLWTDQSYFGTFIKMEPLTTEFHKTLGMLPEIPFVKEVSDEVVIFNEVYYQVTKMLYEHPKAKDLYAYVTEIKADTGWNYSTELVLTMAYFIVALIKEPVRPLDTYFMKAVKKRILDSPYWSSFDHLYYTLDKKNKHITYSFKPSPVSGQKLKKMGYVNWDEVTRHFDKKCINQTVNLWESEEDRTYVSKLIRESRVASFIKNVRDTNDSIVKTCKDALMEAGNKSREFANKQLKKRLEDFDRIMELQVRIAELEEENKRLTTLLETKEDATGKDRKFTLMQIADYCKGCVDWDDAKTIVAMLNKMLRAGSTPEDYKLVDSVENEFKQRATGNTFPNAQVTMQSPQINAPLYEIKDNERVNLGGPDNG